MTPRPSRPTSITRPDDDEEDTAGALIRYNTRASKILQQMRVNAAQLVKLDLSNMLLSPQFFREFSAQRKHNTNLSELHLNNCRLSDKDLQQILKIEHGRDGDGTNKQLEVLSLDKNNLKNVSCYYIARALASVAKVSLNMKYSRAHAGALSMDMGGSRTKNRLRWLSCRRNLFSGADGMRFLADAMLRFDKNLEHLNLSDNDIDDYGAAWLALMLRNNNVLRLLDLRGNERIGKDGLHELRLACEAGNVNLVLFEPCNRNFHRAAALAGAGGASPFLGGGTSTLRLRPRPPKSRSDSAIGGVVGCIGKRNVAVYVDYGGINYGEDEQGEVGGEHDQNLAVGEHQDQEDEYTRSMRSFKPPLTCSRGPFLTMKHNMALNAFEPASIMAERAANDGADFRPAPSAIKGGWCADPQDSRKVFLNEEEVVGGPEALKETCVGLAVSRIRFKPGVDTLGGRAGRQRSRSPGKRG